MGVKKGLACRYALLDFMEQPSLEGSRFSANPKVFPILWNPKFYTVFTRTHDVPLRAPIPSQMNPVYAFLSIFFEIYKYFNIIFSSTSL
jgi:hypothetical protein